MITSLRRNSDYVNDINIADGTAQSAFILEITYNFDIQKLAVVINDHKLAAVPANDVIWATLDVPQTGPN